MSTRDHPDWWRPVGGSNAQDSTLERRSLIWNDGDPTPPDAPPAFLTGLTYRGKFFTRGCRGMIDWIGIYCRRAAAGTLLLHFSPHPGLGPLYAVLVTPGAAWGWAAANFRQMWNYDSLFIWITWCPLDVSWGADEVQPFDAHESLDSGITWIPQDQRPYIRVVYAGETPGDVPVSGIVNTIKIPANGAEVASTDNVNVPSAADTLVAIYEGAGILLQATILIQDADLILPTNPWTGVYYEIRIEADGNAAFAASNRDLTQSAVAATGRSSVGDFLLELTPASGLAWLIMNLRVPIEFRRYVQLRFYHTAGAVLTADGRVYATVMR